MFLLETLQVDRFAFDAQTFFSKQRQINQLHRFGSVSVSREGFDPRDHAFNDSLIDHFAPVGNQYSGGPSRNHKTTNIVTEALLYPTE